MSCWDLGWIILEVYPGVPNCLETMIRFQSSYNHLNTLLAFTVTLSHVSLKQNKTHKKQFQVPFLFYVDFPVVL